MILFIKHRPKIRMAAISCLLSFNFFLIGASYFDDNTLWNIAYSLWFIGTILGIICHFTRRAWYKKRNRELHSAAV